MTGRVYLDWNATAPLRPEAREAMIAALDVVGNPSSVHAEGRAAKALVERARAEVAELVGCVPSEVVFTGGATEGAAMVARAWPLRDLWPVEHDCVWAHLGADGVALPVDRAGRAVLDGEVNWGARASDCVSLIAVSGETGVVQPVDAFTARAETADGGALYTLVDMVQWLGKLPDPPRADVRIVSAHKLGGPKGVGALIVAEGTDIPALLTGGGQELGRRSGTENVIGIAGFGAAAAAAMRDLEEGAWDRVEKLRNILETTLASSANETIFVGKDSRRLPNTSCFAVPGWKGETQVMQMDLAGFAISAGSACSSGKVRESRVLRAMGFDAETARSAVRVSLGPATTEDEVMRFAEAWLKAHGRFRARAA